ncbi:FtsK/SpoIIIE domain-containing protein [Streptomyces ipomoeae]|uniref:FtsK/SpoIIIE domain-containing protein n=1 Tax=Streptomyces ipomoeae TaxID=103232 RepID=UPI0029A06264|nr:FtsK/SpoIIIE domain-containing protein [Streptomyces ipomoeae]MDX2697594.1 FtsK/SpoIIIE domain-containing protein [Streptomyces ipomoeae]MDX2838037.1 FtsK/SpoIIIE domain-containing protein [Streptomyces ipomoeae]
MIQYETPLKTPYGPIPGRVTSRHVARLKGVLRGHWRYLLPIGAAPAWGGWIYTEHLLTDVTWREPLAYGGTGALALTGTVAAAMLGVRNPAALYGGTFVGGTLTWSAWQVAAPSLPGLAIGAVGAVGASVPYWQWLARHLLDRDKLAAKTTKLAPATDVVLAPDDVAGALAATGTPGASLEQMHRHPDGAWTAIVALPVGVSARDIAGSVQRLARLEAALRLPPGWTLAAEGGGASHHLIVTARPPAPPRPEVAIPDRHPLVDHLGEWDPWQPLLAALDTETGESVYLHLLARAGILIAGLQRMGKSVLLSVIVAHLALSKARLILADAKLVELSLWAPLCQREDDFVGRDPEAFLAKLLELQAEIDQRYARLVEEGRTKAAPGDDWEPIGLIVDELAAFIDLPDRKLRGKIVSVLRDVVSRGPACLVAVVLATQKPEDKVVPSQIRDVCGQRVALATTTPQMSDTILGQGWASRGATPHLLGETDKGAAWVLEDGSRPRRVQTFPFEPPARREVIDYARKLWPDRPGAKVPLPGAGGDPDPDPDGGGRPRLRSVPCFPDGTRIPDNRVQLWEAMDRAGSGGFTINDLVALGMPGYSARTSVDGPLQQWRRAGWVLEIGKHGRAQLFALARHAKAA